MGRKNHRSQFFAVKTRDEHKVNVHYIEAGNGDRAKKLVRGHVVGVRKVCHAEFLGQIENLKLNPVKEVRKDTYSEEFTLDSIVYSEKRPKEEFNRRLLGERKRPDGFQQSTACGETT